MNFFKRAWITLWARKGRTALLIITSSVILVFVMAGLIIQNAALTSAKSASDAVGSTVTLTANRDKMFAKMRSQSDSSDTKPTMTIPTTSETKVKKIAALSNVQTYNITNSVSVNASGFKAVTTTSSSEQNKFGGGVGNPDQVSTTGDITISGTSTTAALESFKTSQAKMTSGRGLKTSDLNTNHIVIENELALANGLKVGDTIKITNSTDATKITSLKIVGIYKQSTTETGMQRNDPANVIYGAYTLVNTIAGTENQVSQVTFNMAEPAKTATFVKTAKKILNDSQMSLTSDAADYQRAAKNMKAVASLASKIIWVVAIAGALILGLIILLTTRERRREIGILVSLGESKFKVMAQLFTELLIVLFVALGIATATGTTVSNMVGQSLVTQQQQTTQQSGQGGMPGGGNKPSGAPTNGGSAPSAMGNQTKSQQTSSQLKNTLSIGSILKLGAVAILIALLSVFGGSFMILRMRPKRILQND
ncbi:ABC transporter permease [Weissella diestrammenae]|uniref:ABC transporter permease n=1 Tax=Weissella diestrammenae TaxID=1162633 RepID=A0A7G9T6J5_9LACO|nr:ABC transporter permease [Weissella diestrammenae]MCM0583224.1 ABC transporter permease [Weissella diestrammenae]QNN75720.1 ABC transporter permease [Weissella diestrammenae]